MHAIKSMMRLTPYIRWPLTKIYSKFPVCKSSIHTHSNWLHNHHSSLLSLILILFNKMKKSQVRRNRQQVSERTNKQASYRATHREWHIIKLWYILSYVVCLVYAANRASRHSLSTQIGIMRSRTLFMIQFNCFCCRCWV